IGRLSGTPVEKRHVRSMVDGSRRSTTLYCGLNKKSSNVAPRQRSMRGGIGKIYESTNFQICEFNLAVHIRQFADSQIPQCSELHNVIAASAYTTAALRSVTENPQFIAMKTASVAPTTENAPL